MVRLHRASCKSSTIALTTRRGRWHATPRNRAVSPARPPHTQSRIAAHCTPRVPSTAPCLHTGRHIVSFLHHWRGCPRDLSWRPPSEPHSRPHACRQVVVHAIPATSNTLHRFTTDVLTPRLPSIQAEPTVHLALPCHLQHFANKLLVEQTPEAPQPPPPRKKWSSTRYSACLYSAEDKWKTLATSP